MSPAGTAAGAPDPPDVTGVQGSTDFAAAAGRLAGAAAALLGWRPGEFWAATPAELSGAIRALAGEAPDAAPPPDASTIRRLMEAYPDG